MFGIPFSAHPGGIWFEGAARATNLRPVRPKIFASEVQKLEVPKWPRRTAKLKQLLVLLRHSGEESFSTKKFHEISTQEIHRNEWLIPILWGRGEQQRRWSRRLQVSESMTLSITLGLSKTLGGKVTWLTEQSGWSGTAGM